MRRKNIMTTQIPETSETPDIPETPETPKTPKTPDIPETPENSDTPETPEVTELIEPELSYEEKMAAHRAKLIGMGFKFCDVCNEQITVGLNNAPQCTANTPDVCPSMIAEAKRLEEVRQALLVKDKVLLTEEIEQIDKSIEELMNTIQTLESAKKIKQDRLKDIG